MLYDLILTNAKEWYSSDKCAVKALIDYIYKNGKLREAQTQALLVYLYLKLAGDNKPLAALLNDGFFSRHEDLSSLNINQKAREFLEKNTAAKALFDLSRTPLKNNNPGKKNHNTLFPELEQHIIRSPETIDYHAVGKKLFYEVEYPDYLFSLPMGAGKTFLMAAVIYLDLYFAVNEPDNPAFAHNFIILAPSGLKSSIIPSLKTIEHFDPSWILPEPAAGNIKKMIKFELLDQPKSAKKSNKARNPNAQKVSRYQPYDSLLGLVLIVNAEKVILDRLDLDENGVLYERSDDDRDRFANELRNLIGKIPNLQIHIDEVHHAATGDIKLRQVVNKWNKNGSINSVLGFSGTPYLGKAEKVEISAGLDIKFTQISNTVFYYPLTEAVRKFLKKPRVEQTSGLSPTQIIERGITDFLKTYENKVYDNGCIAKCAVYCGNIERLEEEIFPHLTGKMKINPEEILKYHKGNKRYKIKKEAELEFNAIDTPLSKKKIILLVQVGKEGWDCRSLTGVILSQKGDCPTNMVLQTSCRCLRQVDKDKHETALIWLNEDNAHTLDKQLKEEQHTSIREIIDIGKIGEIKNVERFSRMDYLKLPKIDFYQLNVEYETIVVEADAGTAAKLAALAPRDYLDTAAVIERGLSLDELKKKNLLDHIEGDSINFRLWILTIAKESFGGVSRRDLLAYETQLTRIFNEITTERGGGRYYNELFRQDEIRSRIRLAFHRRRELKMRSEIIPNSAALLVIEKLRPIPENDKLYPKPADAALIMQVDKSGKNVEQYKKESEEARLKLLEFIKSQPNPDLFAMAGFNEQNSLSFSPAVFNKDRTFHYLPYNFSQSRFELTFIQEVLSLQHFHDRGLEIYYNGERNLTDFRIVCYKKKNGHWLKLGLYTPDFLVIKRKDEIIHKIMIVETKGAGYADQPKFIARRHFMETEFLNMNNEKFGYKRFEYIYIPDDLKMEKNLSTFKTGITRFFKEAE